ncbi:hypothetical protein ACJIZ3_016867 [Penstemon smallii]|uniref:Uncharacterized protein n=1 Tax=Penstemon smallii TaxID=265156 RepID=A0ABD3STY8_9LAMI
MPKLVHNCLHLLVHDKCFQVLDEIAVDVASQPSATPKGKVDGQNTEDASRNIPSQGQIVRNSPASRLWRPAAQRNLRNQWSKLASLCNEWQTSASTARSHATSIVNSYLSQRYLDGMDFGVLSDMPNIRTKSCRKLFKQQELYKGELLSSYKDLAKTVTRMIDVCKSMRCYFRGTTNSPLAQFSFFSGDDSDSGDCGGMPVFTLSSIANFEELAWEIVSMFISEINLKRLLVMELLSIHNEKVAEVTQLHWSDEFYEGEFDDLSICSLYSKKTCEIVLPNLESSGSSTTAIIQYKQQKDSDTLQVYITTWMVEVNIDKYRVDEIFAIVGGEMHVDFLQTLN